MNIEELFEKRLLRKISPDKEKSKKSLEIAKKFLKDAKEMKQKIPSQFVILAAYSAMFHSARAILYKDGVQEKSHYATYIYLKNKYKRELGESLTEFNIAREQRHEGLYGLDYEFEEEDYEHIINQAKIFNNKAKQILKEEK